MENIHMLKQTVIHHMNHYPTDMPNPYGVNFGSMALSSDYLVRDNPQMTSRCISGYPLQTYGDRTSSHSQQTSFSGHNTAAAAAMYNHHTQSQQYIGQCFI